MQASASAAPQPSSAGRAVFRSQEGERAIDWETSMARTIMLGGAAVTPRRRILLRLPASDRPDVHSWGLALLLRLCRREAVG